MLCFNLLYIFLIFLHEVLILLPCILQVSRIKAMQKQSFQLNNSREISDFRIFSVTKRINYMAMGSFHRQFLVIGQIQGWL